MIKTILKNSIEYMKSDHKIIRLTFATSFFHSLIASLLIILNVNTLFARNYENGLYVGKVAEFFVQEINTNQVVNRVIGIAVTLFIAYSIIYPIGQAAIIHYLNRKDRSINKALKEGQEDFFPMFEFGIVSLITSPTVYRLTILKVMVSGWLNNSFTVFLLLLRFGIMNLVNCLKVYTRYIITLEKKWLYDAIIRSVDITIKSLKENFKYMGTQTKLLLNFSLNLLLIYAIPLFLIYLAIVFNVIQYAGVKRTVYGIFFFGILFGAYASSMIRAFFAYFRFEIYHKMNKKKD